MLQTLRKKINLNSTIVSRIPVGRIEPNPAQPRRSFNADELRELSHSILENGIIQPITVRKVYDKYILVAGERRLRASIMAGLREIPAIITDIDERESSLVALIENLQRADLSFFEEAQGISNLIRSYGFSQEEAAKKLGKSQSAISNKLRLLRLPAEVSSKIIENNLSERHARALLRLNSEESQKLALDFIIKKNLNVLQTDEYIESLLLARDTPKKRNPSSFYVFKDVRPFLNSIKRAVDTLNSSGVKANISKSEDEDALYMTISVFKNA